MIHKFFHNRQNKISYINHIQTVLNIVQIHIVKWFSVWWANVSLDFGNQLCPIGENIVKLSHKFC